MALLSWVLLDAGIQAIANTGWKVMENLNNQNMDLFLNQCQKQEVSADLVLAQHMIGDLEALLKDARKEIDVLKTENATLKADRTDYETAYNKVMSEHCGVDEWHCSCVPFLRQEIERLKAVLTEISDMDFDKNQKYSDDDFYSGAPKFIESVLKARKVLGRTV
jgi:chromosome segregation ATPase